MPAEEYERTKAETAVNEGSESIVAYESSLQNEASSSLSKRLDTRHVPLGSNPLSVIYCDEANDFGKVLEHGVKNNFGTVEAREALRQRLEDMSAVEEAAQRSILTLSTNSRFIRMDGKGKTRNAHLVVPQVVADEIRRVFDQAHG